MYKRDLQKCTKETYWSPRYWDIWAANVNVTHTLEAEKGLFWQKIYKRDLRRKLKETWWLPTNRHEWAANLNVTDILLSVTFTLCGMDLVTVYFSFFPKEYRVKKITDGSYTTPKRLMYSSFDMITINQNQHSGVHESNNVSLLIHVRLFWFMYVSFDSYCTSLLNHTRTCVNRKRLMYTSFDLTTIHQDQKHGCTWIE